MNKFAFIRVPVLSAPAVVEIESDDTLSTLQAEVGGFICTAGRRRSRVHAGVSLDAWCNDEGHFERLPGNRVVDGVPIVGNIVITAGDLATGDTLTLDAELAVEAIEWARSWPVAIPIVAPGSLS